MADAFHARYAALTRRYRLLVAQRSGASGRSRSSASAGFPPARRGAHAHRRGAFVGTHDFSAFRAAECQAKSPVRTVSQLEIERRGALLRVRIAANAFLHHMVRNIVGALVEVGVSRQAPDWVAEILAARDRRRAAPTFAASGLYLSGVQYDVAFGLPEPRRRHALRRDDRTRVKICGHCAPR